jgi:hypothetical protein
MFTCLPFLYYNNYLFTLLYIVQMITTPIVTTSLFYHDPLCSQVLIQYGPMHWLKGKDVVRYFNDKRVISPWVFDYLLACIRHDDIVHKIDAANFRIFISADFSVSHIPTYTIAQHILSSPFITNSSSQRCTNLSSTHQKTVVPVHRP